MSVQATQRRRRAQWANGFSHLAKIGRPVYRGHKRGKGLSAAIAAARAKAARQREINAPKKR